MNFLEMLRKDKMQSMKDKDKLKTGVISLIMSGIALAEKETKRPLTDDEALAFVQRELKQARDTLEQTPVSRTDIIEETNRRIEIIQSYLPQQMSKEELEKEILSLVKELDIEISPKAKGLIIKETLSRFKGKTDGKSVNEIVNKLF